VLAYLDVTLDLTPFPVLFRPPFVPPTPAPRPGKSGYRKVGDRSRAGAEGERGGCDVLVLVAQIREYSWRRRFEAGGRRHGLSDLWRRVRVWWYRGLQFF
jgi:hypothetical protein